MTKSLLFSPPRPILLVLLTTAIGLTSQFPSTGDYLFKQRVTSADRLGHANKNSNFHQEGSSGISSPAVVDEAENERMKRSSRPQKISAISRRRNTTYVKCVKIKLRTSEIVEVKKLGQQVSVQGYYGITNICSGEVWMQWFHPGSNTEDVVDSDFARDRIDGLRTKCADKFGVPESGAVWCPQPYYNDVDEDTVYRKRPSKFSCGTATLLSSAMSLTMDTVQAVDFGLNEARRQSVCNNSNDDGK